MCLTIGVCYFRLKISTMYRAEWSGLAVRLKTRNAQVWGESSYL